MVRRFFAVTAVAALGVLGAGVGTGFATGVPNHNHFLTTPGSGKVVQVGPHVCDNPAVLHDAFHKFHQNVHTGSPTGTAGLGITAVLC